MRSILYRIPDVLLAQLLGFSLVYALTTSLNLVSPAVGIFLVLLACLVLFTAAFYNRLTSLIFISIAAVGLLVSAYFVFFRVGIGRCLSFLDSYFYWLSEFIYSPADKNGFYQAITIGALCVAAALLFYITAVKRFFFLALLLAGVTLFVVQWSYNYMTTLVPFYVFLAAILMAYFKYIHLRKSRKASNEYLNAGTYILWTLPVCLVVILTASLMHANPKPVEWKWLDKRITSVYNYFNKRFDYQVFEYFSLSSSGFGTNSNLLGGRVRLDTTTVLQVETPRNIYLRGIARDVYTGSKWENSSKETTLIGNNYKTLYEDTSEMLEGMKLLTDDPDFLKKYFYEDNVNIRFMNLKTKSLFIPSKTTKLTTAAKISDVLDVNGSLSSSSRLGSGFSYSVSLYSPRVGNSEFADLLRKSSSHLYADYIKNSPYRSSDPPVVFKVEDKSSGIDSAGHSYIVTLDAAQLDQKDISLIQMAVLNMESKAIREKYLQLPANLPQRVRDLAASITASCGNDYDRMKAIEKYLASKYPYNLDVRSTPKNRDFVDYFLFDLKQGYCSYYASAMAVMARCIGIPARYVEGYMLPPKPVKGSQNTYLVTNMQAHAWVEVYFEGYGWLPFEPTSPFRPNFYDDRTITASVGVNSNSAYEDYMKMMEMYMRRGGGEVDLNLGDLQTYKFPYVLVVFLSVLALLLFITALMSVNIIRSKVKLYKMLNLTPRECVLKLYGYFVDILSLQGLGYVPGETPHQYSKRIDGFMFYSPVKFKAVTDIFVKCRYSTNEINEKEKLLISDFQRSFISETKGNMGKLKYFVYRCILGKI